MSDGILESIDETLSRELPNDVGESGQRVSEKNREEMLELLREAADELGESPTFRAFNELDLDVSGDVIANAFGTWNAAKERAGLETWERGERGTRVPIEEGYFGEIDSPSKAYWLGALVATSSISENEYGDNYQLQIVRTEDYGHFVEAFASEVDSGYPITEYETEPNEKDQIRLSISNPTFLKHLLDAGYPAPDEPAGDFPSIDADLRAPFARGYLESSGYFSTQGWQIKTVNESRARAFEQWFDDFGVKRVTVSERNGGDDYTVLVSNVFDVKTVFEACWPDGLDTTPSYEPYPRKVLDYLEAEYPYPENVEYLSES